MSEGMKSLLAWIVILVAIAVVGNVVGFVGTAFSGDGGGSGYQVTCNDGWTSYSGGKQGACSWHGGVDD